jgi:general secretion pathway protein F
MQYQVTALVDGARVETVAVEAVDAREARSVAQGRGYAVLAVKRRLTLSFGLPERGFPLLLFSQELRVMLDAGLSLPEAMQALVEKESRADLREVLQRVTDALFEGASLSAALARQPRAFPPLYVETVKASEKTGDLAEAMARYIAYQQQVDAIRRKVLSASVYPLVLLGAGVLVALFLLGYVVPRFSAVYDDLGKQMPWGTGLLMGWGRFLHEHAVAAGLAALGAAAGLVYLLSQPAMRARMLRRAWRIPKLGARLRLYELARLYRTLGMLLKSGMPALAAMRSTSGLLGPELRPQLALALADVEQGRAFSQAMAERGLTTPVVLRMLRVGERSGRMSELMERIAAYLEDELARWVDWFSRLFEPILMLAIGAIIGGIVLLMYMPILELAEGLQ